MSEVKVAIYTARIVLTGQGEWKGTYIGKPAMNEIISALYDKRHDEIKDVEYGFKRDQIGKIFTNMVSMFKAFGFPPEDAQYLDCTHFGSLVGRIELVKSGDARISSNGQAALILGAF